MRRLEWLIGSLMFLALHEAQGQERVAEFLGGSFAAGTVICSAGSSRDVSPLRFGLGVVSAVAGVYVAGHWVCGVDGNWEKCLLGGLLGGVVGGLYRVCIDRSHLEESSGQAMMEVDLTFIRDFIEYAIYILPPVLGAMKGLHWHSQAESSLINVSANRIEAALPNVTSQQIEDRFLGVYRVTRVPLLGFSLSSH